MKTLLIKASYSEDSGKFSRDSYAKNITATQLVGENLHATVKRVIEEIDGVSFSYKGTPQSNMYRDSKDGESSICGYIYRVKDEIEGKKAVFDLWVEIREIKNLELLDIEN